MAALISGLAVMHAARGAQGNVPTAGQRPPFFKQRPSALHRLRVNCSHPPTPSGRCLLRPRTGCSLNLCARRST